MDQADVPGSGVRGFSDPSFFLLGNLGGFVTNSAP
jgi:hypothetical protein